MKNTVILSERSEPKDLRTDFTANDNKMRGFFDFAAQKAASLRMTYFYFSAVLSTRNDHLPHKKDGANAQCH